MSYRSLYQSLRGVGVLLALAALVVAGCSTLSNPVSPTTTRHTPSIIRSESFIPVAFDQAAGLSRETLQKPIIVSQAISASEGGTITFSRDLGERGSLTYTLSFPPGALDADTEITVRARERGRLVINLGPDGTQFNVPVTLTMDAILGSGVNPLRLLRKLDIYYYNESTSQWESQGATVVQDGQHITATVQLPHFSQYALGGQ